MCDKGGPIGHIWKNSSLPQFLTNEDMEPFAGATETFSGEELEDLVFSKKLRELSKGLGSL